MVCVPDTPLVSKAFTCRELTFPSKAAWGKMLMGRVGSEQERIKSSSRSCHPLVSAGEGSELQLPPCSDQELVLLPRCWSPMSGVGPSKRGCPGRPAGCRWCRRHPSRLYEQRLPGGQCPSGHQCWDLNALRRFHYAHMLIYRELWLNHYDYLRSQGCLQGLSGRLLLFSTVFNTLIDQVVYDFCCRL